MAEGALKGGTLMGGQMGVKCSEDNQAMSVITYKQEGTPLRMDTFGKRLRLLRQDRNMSQIELREKMENECGVSIGGAYVSELERGKGVPTLPVAAAMAKVLDVSLDYFGLLTDDPSVSYRHAPVVNYLSPEADEMAQLVDSMHPSQREVLLTVAKNMIVSPKPRQLDRAEIRDLLDSIEREHGRAMRLQVEKVMRDRGLAVNTHT
jgi:transcriptional regulator with XRE-family HTH domain